MTVTGTKEVQAKLEATLAAMLVKLKGAAVEICDLLKSVGVQNHPWQNRTGDTEASIDSQVVEEAVDHLVLALSAGMPYDVFVELARDGQWAWLWPAIQANQGAIMDILVRHGAVSGVSSSAGMSTTEKTTGPMQDVLEGNTL